MSDDDLILRLMVIGAAYETTDETIKRDVLAKTAKDALERIGALAAAAIRLSKTLTTVTAERDEAREQNRKTSWMGEGYALVEARAKAAEAVLATARVDGLRMARESARTVADLNRELDFPDLATGAEEVEDALLALIPAPREGDEG